MRQPGAREHAKAENPHGMEPQQHEHTTVQTLPERWTQRPSPG
jgi:hypothetical protein